jgi:hypothetical protein
MKKHVRLLRMRKQPKMQTSIFVALALAVAFIAAPRPTAAQVYHPWCAKYVHVAGTPSCIFDTRSQCMQSIAYGEGYCVKGFTGEAGGTHVASSNGRRRHATPGPGMAQPETHIWTAEAAPPGCTWPYRNMKPPCWSTWPEGDPNYHGSNGK